METLQKTMIESKPILELSKEEFNYSQKPIGKALYKHSVGRPRKEIKCDPKDRIKCSICGKIYTRCASYQHKKTQHHKTHMKINEKLKVLLID
jgi:hypothetical protein